MKGKIDAVFLLPLSLNQLLSSPWSKGGLIWNYVFLISSSKDYGKIYFAVMSALNFAFNVWWQDENKR